MDKEQQLIYLCGLFDGEGTAYIGKEIDTRKRRNSYGCIFAPRIRVNMCDIEPVRIFANYFGGKVHCHHSNQNSEYAPAYIWAVQGREIIPVAKSLLQYTIIERKRHALECVLKCAETISTKKGRRKLPYETHLLRGRLYKECMRWNARGRNRNTEVIVSVEISPQLEF